MHYIVKRNKMMFANTFVSHLLQILFHLGSFFVLFLSFHFALECVRFLAWKYVWCFFFFGCRLKRNWELQKKPHSFLAWIYKLLVEMSVFHSPSAARMTKIREKQSVNGLDFIVRYAEERRRNTPKWHQIKKTPRSFWSQFIVLHRCNTTCECSLDIDDTWYGRNKKRKKIKRPSEK